jgi:hypothetical protein
MAFQGKWPVRTKAVSNQVLEQVGHNYLRCDNFIENDNNANNIIAKYKRICGKI